jgi:hypothetical protein
MPWRIFRSDCSPKPFKTRTSPASQASLSRASVVIWSASPSARIFFAPSPGTRIMSR